MAILVIWGWMCTNRKRIYLFKDLSDQVIADEVFQRLLTFPNVLITGHQAFFTAEALQQICQITAENLLNFQRGQASANWLTEQR